MDSCCTSQCLSICQPAFRRVFLSAYRVFLHDRLSVSLEETQLSHVSLWHSNFPLDCYWKMNQVVEKGTHDCDPLTMTEAQRKERQKSDDIRNDTPLHFTSILSVRSPSGTYPLLCSCLVLSFSNVVYLELQPTRPSRQDKCWFLQTRDAIKADISEPKII